MIVELTEEQMAEVAPLLAKASKDSEAGKPGIVIAQVFSDAIQVGFLPHEKAKLFEKTARLA
ncbi:MAG: hypothetical protein ABW134_11625 [Candidatus Thiodiazotropha endolucinida]